MIKVYLAAPIIGITEEMKNQILAVKNKLTEVGFEVYDPRENGAANSWGCSLDEWCRVIFELDVAAINRSDWIVVLDYGRYASAGTAWECGYAFGKSKDVLVIEMYEENEYSVMIRGCSSNYCKLNDFMNEDIPDILFVERGRMNTDENKKIFN